MGTRTMNGAQFKKTVTCLFEESLGFEFGMSSRHFTYLLPSTKMDA